MPATKDPRGLVPVSCPVCNKCWLITKGPNFGRCVHGGPYKGYVKENEGSFREPSATEEERG